MRAASPRARLIRVFKRLFPVYLTLTATLALCLVIAGDTPLDGVMHAMAVLSTSGISAQEGISAAQAGWTGEVLIFLFLVFALSRLTFSTDTAGGPTRHLMEDPEFRIGLVLVIGVPLLLFARHWLGALDVNAEGNIADGISALWGGMFTVLSFLTTTGFVSAEWEAARGWSGLSTSGIILMGLAMVGGGVATTAGGVKLLRVFSLYLNGVREMERLVHPNAVSGTGQRDRRIRRQGTTSAWIFFMLFAISLAIVMLALTAYGASFSEGLILSVAALSTTGPLLAHAGSEPIMLSSLTPGAKLIFATASVLGRLETLAIIAMITPDLWRR